MKTINAQLLILLTVFFVSSCQQKTNTDQDVPVFEARFADRFIVGDYFSKLDYIFLEDCQDGLFSEADDIVYFEDSWYILDKNLKTLLCFEGDGSFRFKIQAVGRGPGEYQLPESFLINSLQREIWIQCRQTARILKYDLNGKFLSDEKIGRAGFQLIRFNDHDILAFDSDYHYLTEKDSVCPGVFRIGKDFNSSKQLFFIRNNVLINDLTNGHCLSMQEDTCFIMYGSDSLFCLSQDQQSHLKGVFDFGKYHLPEQIHNLPRRYSNYDQILNSGKVIWKDRLLPTQNFLFLTIGLNNAYWYGLVNRLNNEFIVTQSFVNDLTNTPFIFPIAKKSSDELVGYISADYILAMEESLSRIDPENRPGGFDEIQSFVRTALEKSGNILVIMTLKNESNE